MNSSADEAMKLFVKAGLNVVLCRYGRWWGYKVWSHKPCLLGGTCPFGRKPPQKPSDADCNVTQEMWMAELKKEIVHRVYNEEMALNMMKEEAQDGFMVLFPNPVERNKTFSLAIPEDETLAEIVVVDMLGEEVVRKSGALKPTEIAGLPVSGIYVVKAVTRSGNVYYGRLVVK